jgi:CRP/FNR family transcriptional regulator, cyclic AMP receptor protein
MDPLELFCAHPLLSQLTEAEVGRLRKRAITRRWKKGDVIFRKGDACNSVIFVLSGSALTVMHSGSGTCHPTDIYGRGDILGVVPVLDGGRRQFTAVAREATCALCLDRREFNDVVASRPELRVHIIAYLCVGVRMLYARNERMIFLDVPARLAGLLLLLHQRYAVADGDTKQPSIYFSQREIAELLGFSREWVGRELVKLRKAGIVELRRSRLVVRDKVALQELAELGPYLEAINAAGIPQPQTRARRSAGSRAG